MNTKILIYGNTELCTACTTQGVLYGAALACLGMPCLVSCTYRTKLRSQYQLMETPAPDWFTHCFCEPCALCQEYRELRHRGFDPSIGNPIFFPSFFNIRIIHQNTLNLKPKRPKEINGNPCRVIID